MLVRFFEPSQAQPLGAMCAFALLQDNVLFWSEMKNESSIPSPQTAREPSPQRFVARGP